MSEEVLDAKALGELAVQALRDAEAWLAANTVATDNVQAAGDAGPSTIDEVPAERLFDEVWLPLSATARKAVRALEGVEAQLPEQVGHAMKVAHQVTAGKAKGALVARHATDLAIRALKRQFEQLGILQPEPA